MRVADGNYQIPYISGSNFGSDLFYLDQFHFHWGSNHSFGSEHHIDDGIFPLEVAIYILFIVLFSRDNSNGVFKASSCSQIEFR